MRAQKLAACGVLECRVALMLFDDPVREVRILLVLTALILANLPVLILAIPLTLAPLVGSEADPAEVPILIVLDALEVFVVLQMERASLAAAATAPRLEVPRAVLEFYLVDGPTRSHVDGLDGAVGCL